MPSSTEYSSSSVGFPSVMVLSAGKNVAPAPLAPPRSPDQAGDRSNDRRIVLGASVTVRSMRPWGERLFRAPVRSDTTMRGVIPTLGLAAAAILSGLTLLAATRPAEAGCTRMIVNKSPMTAL